MPAMLRAAPLAAFLVVLAGCSSPPDPENAASSTSSYSITADSLRPAVVLTDTLHLLDAPHVAAALPAGGAALERPLCARGVGVTVGGNPVVPACVAEPWTLPRPDGFTTLVGSVTFWVDVQGTVTNSNPSDPCFWEVSLYAPAPADGGAPVSVSDQERLCAPEPPVVPTGIRALRFDIPVRTLSDASGGELRLDLYAYGGVLGPGATMKVLMGTPEHDSQITLSGLQVPLSTQTYLAR